MKNLCFFSNRKNSERGISAIEFAWVAIPFFLLLLGVMELGRLVYLWNTVQEVTRNAARLAVVTDFTDNAAIEAIKRAAIFRSTDGNLPASFEISNVDISIKFLNAQGDVAEPMPSDPGDNISACLDSMRANSCIKYVEVSVCSGVSCLAVPFVPMTGLFSKDGKDSVNFTGLLIPKSTVRMPAESLGFTPY